MNLNGLWLLAPVAALGVWIFSIVYDRQDSRHDAQRARVEVRALEAQQRFAQAWGGQAVTGPSQGQIDEARQALDAAKAREQQARDNAQQSMQAVRDEVISTTTKTTEMQ